VLRGRLQRAAEARPQPTEVTPALAPPNDTAPAA
jgi:hypothetical protein